MPSRPTTDVLVVAAHPPELDGLRPLLGEGLAASVEGRAVVAAAVGIGLVAASSGMAARLAASKPGCVIVTGTCGVYAPHTREIPLGTTVVGARLYLASTSAVEGRGAMPAPMEVALGADAGLTDSLSAHGSKKVSVATTLAITTDDELARRIAETLGCEVEHMEAFAMASACARVDVPVALVLGIANQVGKSARQQWRDNHESAGRAATDVISDWLRRGAPRSDVSP